MPGLGPVLPGAAPAWREQGFVHGFQWELLRNPVWIQPLSLSSFVQSCPSSQIVLLQSETPSEQLPLSITLPDSLDYQEENWSEHLPVLINCVAQVI